MNRTRLSALIENEYTYTSLLDDRITEETNGAYGELRVAIDKGDSVGIIDVIDAEHLLDHLDDDEAARAAATLSMCGWKPDQIGGIINPRHTQGRPGRKLLADACLLMSVRERQAEFDRLAKRDKLRQRDAV